MENDDFAGSYDAREDKSFVLVDTTKKKKRACLVTASASCVIRLLTTPIVLARPAAATTFRRMVQAPVQRRDTTVYQHPQHGQHFKRAHTRREPYNPQPATKLREKEPSVKVP